MREILVGWMIFVHDHFALTDETLYFSIMIVDKMSGKAEVHRNRYKLLGITALFMAAKFYELKVPKLKNYVKICDDSTKYSDILETEAEILQAFNFELDNQTLTF